MGYAANEPLTLYVVKGPCVHYRDVLVVRSGVGNLVLADKMTADPLTIAYDPANPYQDFRQVIERTRNRLETVQRAKEVWSFERYRRLLSETRRLFIDATTGEGTARSYPGIFFDDDEPPTPFASYWGERLSGLPQEPEVINVTGTSIEAQPRPIKGTMRST